MKILIISNLFPNSKEPTRGIFNQQQFSELEKLCQIKVVAPVPWTPFMKWMSNRWRTFSEIPEREIINGIDVYHPRYFMTPGFGHLFFGFYFFLSLLGKVKEIHKEFNFDLILSTWAFPDGFGSLLIAKALKKPMLMKVHGSDINLYSRYFFRRRLISYALRQSKKVIAVSNSLKARMMDMGVPDHKIVVIPNGVNTNLFRLMDQTECRKSLNLPEEKRVILFVGNLVPVKGVDYLLEAYSDASSFIRNTMLIIIGDGSSEKSLKKETKRLGLGENVKFVSRQPYEKIPVWMNACDLFCLPSLNEGCPNVVLEAFACGKPVVASSVGGVPELITSEDVGLLVASHNSKALSDTLKASFNKKWDAEKIREHSLKFDWTVGARKIEQESNNGALETSV